MLEIAERGSANAAKILQRMGESSKLRCISAWVAMGHHDSCCLGQTEVDQDGTPCMCLPVLIVFQFLTFLEVKGVYTKCRLIFRVNVHFLHPA